MDEKDKVRHLVDNYSAELENALADIIDYWITYTVDTTEGGFYGKIDNENNIVHGSPKGSVLNARILWSFSSAYNHTGQKDYLEIADRAYQYLADHFIDKTYGGVYWTVDHTGNKLDPKKQVYASAFVIYGLSEYYKAVKREDVIDQAISLFRLLVDKAFDWSKTGYFEAFTEDWRPISDLRLSAKDANEKKTMNTHLHVLEAYANLYRVWPDKTLKNHIILLLNNFSEHFIGKGNGHLNLFFDEHWQRRSTLVSYGHDIEAAWLLLDSAQAINDGALIESFKMMAMKITKAAAEGLDNDGGLWYEFEPTENHLVKEKHWWVQAEAMLGFFNAWQLSGDEQYLQLSIKNWEFVKDKILDKKNDEWFWGVDENGRPMQNEDKAGLWKCPYHNSRACIEIVNRIKISVPAHYYSKTI